MTDPTQASLERARKIYDTWADAQVAVFEDIGDADEDALIVAIARALDGQTKELEADAAIDSETAIRNRDLYYELERNVGRLYPITEKHDVSITYRQSDKRWLVRFISWGPEQTMFTGEDANLMTAALKAHEAYHAAIRQEEP